MIREAVERVGLRMTYEEFQEWWHEGHRGEWVDGEAIAFGPTPDRAAQVKAALSRRLAVHLGAAGGCERIPGPLEMRTRAGSARFPDLMVILDRSADRLSWERLRGPADVVVEVVTDDSARRDRVEKVREYAACGVPEYWLVDPRPGWGTTELLVLGFDGRYAVIPPDARGRLWSRVLDGFWVRTGMTRQSLVCGNTSEAWTGG